MLDMVFNLIESMQIINEADDDKDTDTSLDDDTSNTSDDAKSSKSDDTSKDGDSNKDDTPKDDTSTDDMSDDQDDGLDDTDDLSADDPSEDSSSDDLSDDSTSDDTSMNDTGEDGQDPEKLKKVNLIRRYAEVYDYISMAIKKFKAFPSQSDKEKQIIQKAIYDLNYTRSAIYDYLQNSYENNSYATNLYKYQNFAGTIRVCAEILQKIKELRQEN